MKKIIVIIILLSSVLFLRSQVNTLDSLHNNLLNPQHDSLKVFTFLRIGNEHFFSSPDSAMTYAEQGHSLAKKINFTKGEAQSLAIIGNIYMQTGNYVKAMETHLKALEIQEKRKDRAGIAAAYNNMAMVYQEQQDFRNSVDYFLRAKQIFEIEGKNNDLLITLLNIGNIYEKINKLDSGLFFSNKAYKLALSINDRNNIGTILSNLGNINYKLGNYELALRHYRTSLGYATQINDKINLSDTYYGLSLIFQKKNQADSGIHYAKMSLAFAKESEYSPGLQNASNILSTLYESVNNIDSAYTYYKTAMNIRDTMFNAEIVRTIQTMNINERLRQKEIIELREEERARARARFNQIISLVGVAVFLIIALFLWRTNGLQKNANRMLKHKNEQIETQHKTLEKTFAELKGTQAQLIQKEKMASLGELTAGIAHEIQNPLNFVNNFSEVSKELMDELQEEISRGHKEEIEVLAADIKENLAKITHHGRRAEVIVKDMLQHSRRSLGQRELTDINLLIDEYVRLSYNNFRLKNKSFNAIIETDFDNSISKLWVVPQDLGQVLLNIFNNAFYSVSEKKKKLDKMYEPTLIVSTKKLNKQIRISIKDNGMGIKQNILEKIYHPFFTTKPTGEGTGLGLSVSYDIITKGHGGELNVKSQERNFAEFEITLPT